jgi:hypothetical protein
MNIKTIERYGIGHIWKISALQWSTKCRTDAMNLTKQTIDFADSVASQECTENITWSVPGYLLLVTLITLRNTNRTLCHLSLHYSASKVINFFRLFRDLCYKKFLRIGQWEIWITEFSKGWREKSLRKPFSALASVTFWTNIREVLG